MKTILRCIMLIALVVSFSSCHPYKSSFDSAALSKASARLGIEIDKNDNHDLYVASSQWLSTPYRAGGTTRRGVDCSGLTMAIYNKVYRRTLPHSSADQYSLCRRVPKRKLQEGDLLFFSTDGKRKRVGHVGIYLKDGQFVHASTRSGVTISRLSEKYYTDNWICGGRVK